MTAHTLRRHALVIVVAVGGALSLAAFTWANWHSFAMRQHQAHVTPVFWSKDYLAEWLYNTASNWQSEMLFGILLLVSLKKAEGPDGADRDAA